MTLNSLMCSALSCVRVHEVCWCQVLLVGGLKISSSCEMSGGTFVCELLGSIILSNLTVGSGAVIGALCDDV